MPAPRLNLRAALPVLFSLLMLLAALALPAGAFAATPEEEGAKAKALLLRYGHTDDVAEKIAGMVRESHALDAAGLRQEAALVTVDVLPVPKSRKDLAQVINGGDLLPEDRAPLPPLTRENFAAIVERLYAPDDLGLWMRDAQGQPLDAAGLANARKRLVQWKNTMLERPAKDGKEYGEALVDQWLALFNRASASARFPAREVYRRLLNAAPLVVGYPLLAKTRPGWDILTATALGEMLFLTTLGAEDLPRVNMTYKDKSPGFTLLPARLPQALAPAQASIPARVDALLADYGNQNGTDAANRSIAEEKRKQAEEKRKQAVLDSSIAEEKHKQAVLDSSIAEEKRKQAVLDSSIAEEKRKQAEEKRKQAVLDKIIEINKTVNGFAREIPELIKAYVDKPSRALREKTERRIQEFEQYEQVVIEAEKTMPDQMVACRMNYGILKSMWIPKFRRLAQQGK